MKPEFYKIEQLGNGFLAMMAKPRTGDWIEDEFAGLSASGIHLVVSLLEPMEADELGLKNENEFQKILIDIVIIIWYIG